MSKWQIDVQHINNMLDNCSYPCKPLLQHHGKFVLFEPPRPSRCPPLKISNDLLWGGYGYFLKLYNNISHQTSRKFVDKVFSHKQQWFHSHQTCSWLSGFQTDRYPSNLWQVWVCTLNVSLVFECKYSTDGWMTYLRCWESLLSIGSSEKIWFFKAIPGKMESQFTSKHSSTPGYLHYYCSNYAFCISCNNYTKVYVPLGYSSSLSKALEIITRQALIKENQSYVNN